MKIKITNADFNGVMANQEFTPLVATNQVGDTFYVPNTNLLLVLGTGINARNADGEELHDEDGNAVRRQVAQHFCVVRIVDNVPIDVRELYVGQLVKVDLSRKIMFPGVLSKALQRGDDAFKKAICGNILQIVEDGFCTDRVWDNKVMRWKRNADDSFVGVEKRVFHFEPTRNVMSAEAIEEADKMLMDYYNERYAEYVATVEE